MADERLERLKELTKKPYRDSIEETERTALQAEYPDFDATVKAKPKAKKKKKWF